MATTVQPLTGTLDMAGARELHARAQELARSANGDLALDCSGVERIDAAGAQILVALGRSLTARGWSLELRNVPERVLGLLERTGIADLVGAARRRVDAANEEERREQ